MKCICYVTSDKWRWSPLYTFIEISSSQVGEYREDTGVVWTHGSQRKPWHHQNFNENNVEDQSIKALALAAFQREENENKNEGIIKSVLTSHQVSLFINYFSLINVLLMVRLITIALT